jgi:hypothetical protein
MGSLKKLQIYQRGKWLISKILIPHKHKGFSFDAYEKIKNRLKGQ